MVWNIAEFITLCVNHKGIHPGAHIALDLILFGLLDGPGSIIIVVYSYFSDRYYNDCSDSEVCSGVSNSRRLSFRPGGIAIGTLIIIAGYVTSFFPSLLLIHSLTHSPFACDTLLISEYSLVHLALFILACISVHKWRMARRDRRHAQMQAAYSNPTGQISVAGNMDPNTAYIVTYPDGRQVIVPPQTQQQQQPTPQPHGYYAPPAQQNMTPVPHSHGISPAPVAMGAGTLGAGALAGQHMTSQNTSHSPVSQLSQPLPDGQRAVPESVVSGRTATDSLYAHSHNDVAEAPAVGNMPRPAEAVPEQR
jgi:hypothetical protein